MSKNQDIFDAWGGELEEDNLESIEDQLVERHDGSVVHVPTSVAATILGYLMSSVEEDIRADGEIDFETHQQFVYAYQLDNCVHDDWNGRWSGNE